MDIVDHASDGGGTINSIINIIIKNAFPHPPYFS